jgi:hypothetical protein
MRKRKCTESIVTDDKITYIANDLGGGGERRCPEPANGIETASPGY